MAEAVWQAIHASLEGEIAGGRYLPGERLPTEAELAARFGVNRHTVRRALAALADAGLVHSRRGAGVYVMARPTEYPLGRRVRFRQNLAAAGREAETIGLRLETRPSDGREAGALGLAVGDPVHLWEGISFADGVPIAVFRSAFPAERLPGIPAALGDLRSVTAALRACGVPDYVRVSTRLSAERATATRALHLRCAVGAPLLRSVAVNADSHGQPVEYGRTWFSGERIQLVVGPEPGGHCHDADAKGL